MKIMHVEAGKHLYGGALQVFYLMRGLQRLGCENILVCPSGSVIGQQSRQIAQVEEVKMGGDLDFGFCSRLVSLLNKYQPDVLHIHSRRGADHFGAIAAGLTGTKAVLTRRVDNSELKLATRLKARFFKQLVAISEGIRQVQIQLGVSPKKIRTIHSAVDTEKFRPQTPGETDEVRARFTLPSDSIVVGVIAQLIERKGHRYLFDALPELLREFPKLHLLVLGKGPHEMDLVSYVHQLQLDSHVTFAGFQPDIEKLIPNLDLVVHPALKEGLGVALLQASACAIPIVACGVGGIPEIVQHEKNGLIVPPADSAALLAAIQKVLREKELYQSLASQGRLIAETEFSIEAMVRGNYQLYQEITTEH